MADWRARLGLILLGGVTVGMTPAALADDETPPAPGPTRAEFNKLQAEVREQRQLIIQMMQNEQQRYDMLLQLLRAQDPSAPAAAAPPATAAAPVAVAEPSASARSAPEAEAKRARAEGERRTGAVEGRVTVPNGEVGEVYVYVDGIRATPVRNRSIEIKQEGRQFVPRVAVVQSGTSVTFPNFDSVYHNVFSNSPRNSFDLGTYRAGDKPRSVTLAAPGIVEVFCNMHQKMSANILVVPNALYAQVKPNGSFRLTGVPVGPRSIVAWSPNSRPVQQRVDVTASGAQVSFTLERQQQKAHANKLGQPYGSYRD
jgi:plastocyanin